MIELADLKQVRECVWEIPKSYRSDMRCAARVYISREGLENILGDKSLDQLINVTSLPGVEHAFAMPDIHQGYGFPIGGVAAIRSNDGVISPGGVGYDINCGVRVLKTPYIAQELADKMEELANQTQRDVPSGVGRGGFHDFKAAELDKILNTGMRWALKAGYAAESDLEFTEEHGSYRHADAACVSDQAKQRGADQLGTIGAGNHFVEIQQVVEIGDRRIAEIYGIFLNQVVIMIHTGSRGLGHQICTDYVKVMNQVRAKYGIELPDRELACAPFRSKEGQDYFKAMAAAANYAWTNRQLLTHQIREAWHRVLRTKESKNISVLYDVAHNIAKLESHNGVEYIVHRKGATRSFGPGSSEIPDAYRTAGQPVLIPGSMGTYSFVLAGTERAMQTTFGSSCHGAGRSLSRIKAKKIIDYNRLSKQLEDYGVVVRAGSAKGLLEEAPQAYKNVDDVVNTVEKDEIAKTVARLKPLAVIKG